MTATLNTPLRAEPVKVFGTERTFTGQAKVYDANGKLLFECDKETAAAIVERLNTIAAVIDGLDEISRDAWSGERDRLNRIGRMADSLKAALAAGGNL